MSVRVSTWVWHETTASGSDLLVLLALADSANDDGECWPGVDVLVDKTRMSRATVFRRLDALEAAGLLERDRRGKRQTNVYRVCVPWVKSQIETSVKSQNATSEVSPVRLVKSHGCDFQGTVSEPSLKRQGPRKRGSRVPEDLRVDDAMRAWAASQGWPHLDLEAITVEFVDYWLGVPGQRGVKLDWPATWRNWVRRKAADAPAGRRSAWARARVVEGGTWSS